MAIVFISDLHLSEHEPHKTELFINFLKNYSNIIDTLYILGDFFDFWIGDDIQINNHLNVIKALNEFNKDKSRTYFMHGNRDFLIGTQFLKQSNCKFIKDPSIINVYDMKTLITHGDLLDQKDYLYQFYRKTVRLNFMKKLFYFLPNLIRLSIGKSLRKMSKITNISVQENIDISSIEKTVSENKIQILIKGHTHQPCIELLNLDQKLLQVITLSDWGKKGNMLICDKNQKLRLTYFDNNFK